MEPTILQRRCEYYPDDIVSGTDEKDWMGDGNGAKGMKT
jgi:hypothetical protein